MDEPTARPDPTPAGPTGPAARGDSAAWADSAARADSGAWADPAAGGESVGRDTRGLVALPGGSTAGGSAPVAPPGGSTPGGSAAGGSAPVAPPGGSPPGGSTPGRGARRASGRLDPLTPDRLDPAQRRLYDSIVGGKRSRHASLFRLRAPDGSLYGPFNPMLTCPSLGQHLDRLGAALRFETSLPDPVREAVILLIAQWWRSEYEWYAHRAVARTVGLTEEVIDALRAGRIPTDAPADVLAALRVCVELRDHGTVGDGTYRAALDRFGPSGMVELTVLFGYYVMLAAMMNTFDVALPEGVEPDLG